jgi:hypothetical protein
VVENNEIDIELPSHDVMFVFATEVELGTAHFHKVFLNERIAIEADPDVSKRGTWQLNNIASPNLLSSWTKVSSQIHKLSQPTVSNLKANVWKGELGAGNGITFGTDPYADEYFAQLTPVGIDMWDGAYHEYAFEWRASGVRFFVDGVEVQVADAQFNPDVPGRFTLGMWFPSQADPVYPWLVNPNGGWAAPVANWKYQKMLVKKITFSPYGSVEAGGVNRLVGETYPFDGFKEIL